MSDSFSSRTMYTVLIRRHTGCAPEDKVAGSGFGEMDGDQFLRGIRMQIHAVDVMVILFPHSTGGVPLGQVFGQGKEVGVAGGGVVVVIGQENIALVERAIGVGEFEMEV